jgi:hypothetical protein
MSLRIPNSRDIQVAEDITLHLELTRVHYAPLGNFQNLEHTTSGIAFVAFGAIVGFPMFLRKHLNIAKCC